MRHKCPCKFSCQWMSLFFPKVFYYKENTFFKLLARLQTRDINGRSPNRLTWRWQFFFLVEKKKQEIFRSRHVYMGVYISCKLMHNRMHNAMARSGLETKFLRRRFIRKGNCSIATMNLLARKIWSNFFLIFTFVIMQVVLLNIFLGRRWNAVRKSRLRRTP